MSDSLRIIFAGTPDFAARHLDALLTSGHNVVGVFTQPDRPAGRGKVDAQPGKSAGGRKGLPVFQPVSLRPQENQQLVADLHADVMVVVAYGLILPKAVLDMPVSDVSTFTVRCFHAGAARRLFSAHFGQAMRKPASQLCRWM